MDFFEPATTESESPNGQEELEAVEENHEQETTDDVNEEETNESVEEPELEEPEDPQGQSEELFWGKFKTPEDAQKAYENLQREYTKMRMEQKSANQQQPQQEQIQQQHELNLNDPSSIIDAINQDPAGTIAKIAQMTYQQARTVETAQQQFNRGLNEVAETYGEYLQNDDNQAAYFGKVDEICREMGVSANNPSPRILKMAAQELFGMPGQQTINKVYEQAKQKTRAELEASRRQKTGLSAPTGAKQTPAPKTPEELIREGIIAASRTGGMFG